VVLLVTVVGIVMVIALLTLPVAVTGHFAKRLWQMMAFSAILTALLTSFGLLFSYGPDLPAGATTIVLAGAVYLMVVGVSRFIRLKRT
jgi:zinc transport system permease protein